MSTTIRQTASFSFAFPIFCDFDCSDILLQDDFGLLTLGDQLENGAGTSSSFEAFGLSARQNQQLKSHGTVGNNAVIATDWRRRNQVGMMNDNEYRQFSDSFMPCLALPCL